MSYGQFSNLDSGSIEHVDWDIVYVVVTHVIIDIIDACIVYNIDYNYLWVYEWTNDGEVQNAIHVKKVCVCHKYKQSV